ncbi:MAG: hypothetical protein GW938_07580 [Leptospira sp.]|jgi:hypothetical protein|nr:hypothetical protein [Leptospira sp.]
MATQGTRPNPNVLTGNDALVKWNGTTLGFMKSLSVDINNNVQPIQALGFRKPRGLKSLQWSGEAQGEFHILRTREEGIADINTSDDERADEIFMLLVIDKKSGKRVCELWGAIGTEGFNLNNNEFSGKRVSIVLMDFVPLEAYN